MQALNMRRAGGLLARDSRDVRAAAMPPSNRREVLGAGVSSLVLPGLAQGVSISPAQAAPLASGVPTALLAEGLQISRVSSNTYYWQ